MDVPVDIVLVSGGIAPKYAHDEEDTGADVFARGQYLIPPGGADLVCLGFKAAPPRGWAFELRQKSGLSTKRIRVDHGTIDNGYRGELKAHIINESNHDLTIEHGDKVGQLVLEPVYRAVIRIVDSLPESSRGAKGFGSTGKRY